MTNDVYHQHEYRLRNSGSKKQHMDKTKEEPISLGLEELRAALAGIHYIANRRIPPTSGSVFDVRASFMTIRDECERCIPKLKQISGVSK